MSGDPKPRAPRITEAAFMRQVLDLARMTGWRTAHFRPARTARGNYVTAVSGDGVGFPDLVLVRDRVIYRELKTDTGRIRAEQIEWQRALLTAGADFAIWRPADWRNIEATLTRRDTVRRGAGL